MKIDWARLASLGQEIEKLWPVHSRMLLNAVCDFQDHPCKETATDIVAAIDRISAEPPEYTGPPLSWVELARQYPTHLQKIGLQFDLIEWREIFAALRDGIE